MLDIHDHEAPGGGVIRELRLARPPVNALNGALVARMRVEFEALGAAHGRAFDDVASPKAIRAVVLSGQPGIFSAGLDVRELAQATRDGVRAFLTDFVRLQTLLAFSPIPVIAAITGHCPAGGTVLTLFCDYRVMASGDYRIGLNEVQVGLYPGPAIHRAFQRLVGVRRAAHWLTTAALVEGATALQAGLVDELAPAADVIPKALQHARELLSLPRIAYARTRTLVREDLHAAFSGDPNTTVDEALEIFTGAESQVQMRALLTKR